MFICIILSLITTQANAKELVGAPDPYIMVQTYLTIYDQDEGVYERALRTLPCPFEGALLTERACGQNGRALLFVKQL